MIRIIFLDAILILLNCRTENGAEPLMNEYLKKEIKFFILSNKLSKECELSVYYIEHCYNYSTFQINTDRRSQPPIYKCEIDGHNIYFYSGLERYLLAPELLSKNPCSNEGNFSLIVDSSGVFYTVPDIGIYPACQIPKIRNLETMQN